MLSIRQLLLQGSLCRTNARVVPTVRRRLQRIVRNSLWLSLTHYATSPFPQKSRSARLFGCKRPHDGSLSLPTFADFGQPQGLSLRYDIFFNLLTAVSYHISVSSHGGSKPPPYTVGYKIQSVRLFMTNRSNRYTDNRFRQCSLFCPEDRRPKANRTSPQPLRDCYPAQP